MPKLSSFLIALTTTGLVFASSSCAQLTGDRSGDVDRLADYLDQEQSFSEETRREILAGLPALRARAESMTDAEFFLAVARRVALADNGHSNVVPRTIAKRFGLVPVRAYWFSDGPHVVRAREEHEDLLGVRIVEIAGVPVAEAETRMKAFHGGTMEHFRASFARFYLLSPPLLHAEGIAPRPDRLELTLRLHDGSENRVVLEPEQFSGGSARTDSWRVLHPKAIRGEASVWRTVHSGAGSNASSDPLPLYLQDPDEDFRYRMLDGSTAYLQLRNNHSSGRRSVRDFLDDVRERLAEDTPRHMILDMRQNRGGDLSRSAQFMLDLPDLLPPDGRVYVITGNATFSAGIYSSFYTKSVAPDRTLIVGERVGDRERFWAESAQPVVLSDGSVLTISLQMHDIGPGCHDETVCHMLQYPASWNLAIGSVDPDVPVPTTFADYEARRDPPLQRVLARIATADPPG